MGSLSMQLFLATKTTEQSNWSNSFGMIDQFFYIKFIAAFVLILVLAYASTKWLASSRYKRMGANIRVIDTYTLNITSSIQLVQVGKRVVLLGVSKDRVQFLADVDPSDINIPPERVEVTNVFEKYLNRHLFPINNKPEEKDNTDENK